MVGAQTWPQSSPFASGATTTINRSGTATPVCSKATVLPETDCTQAGLPVGTYTFTATYSGNIRATGSTSDPFSVTVVPNVVHATGIGVSATVIYPVVDSYYDTVAIRGTRQEAISVGIRIYNSSNVLVKSVSYPLASGSYSYTWNGRNSHGTILAEGSYRVVQALKDATGTTLSLTRYVTLSKKYLHWHTTSITKLGSAFNSSGQAGAGSVTYNTTYGYVRLNAPAVYADWAGAGWQFGLPAATSYRNIAFLVYAKHVIVAGGYTRLGAQNFTTCAYSATAAWAEACFDSWHPIGNSAGSLAWFTTGNLSSVHRYSRVVRGMVGETGGQTYIYKAQLNFQYSTLSY